MEKSNEIILTENEKVARKWFLHLMTEGKKVKCDIRSVTGDTSFPPWYDEAKCKRGMRYYMENRFAILSITYLGTVCQMADLKTLRTLEVTSRSSTMEATLKRFLDAAFHLLKWYEYDFTPGSPSYKSVRCARSMHVAASNLSEAQNKGYISQINYVIVASAYIGFTLQCPNLFGVKEDDHEGCEGFIHLWAVFSHFLGIEERFNFCLLPFDILKIFVQMVQRYIFIPVVQLPPTGFTQMMEWTANVINAYIPLYNLEIDIFLMKRVLGVPGYQYRTDLKKQFYCKPILSQEDIDFCNNNFKERNQIRSPFFKDIPVITINRGKLRDSIKHLEEDFDINLKITNPDVEPEEYNTCSIETLKSYLKEAVELCPCDSVTLTLIKDDEWATQLSDKKFYEMTLGNKVKVTLRCFMTTIYRNKFGRYLLEKLTAVIIHFLRRDAKKLKGNPFNFFPCLNIVLPFNFLSSCERVWDSETISAGERFLLLFFVYRQDERFCCKEKIERYSGSARNRILIVLLKDMPLIKINKENFNNSKRRLGDFDDINLKITNADVQSEEYNLPSIWKC